MPWKREYLGKVLSLSLSDGEPLLCTLGGPGVRGGDVCACSVSQALRENTYPFLAVIMLKDRRMTVVGRLEGLIQADDLINQLMFIMDANQTYLVSERLERYGGTGAAAAQTML